MSVWQYLVDIIIVSLFILLNGFFVAAEFAIVKVRLTQIEPLLKKDRWRARIAREILLHSTAYLSATQLGITMTSLVLGWIGEPMTAEMLHPVFLFFGLSDPHLLHGISFAVAFACITAFHIVVGEQAPKVLAIQKSRETLLAVSSPLRFFFLLFKPIITALNAASTGLLRLLGFHASADTELAHSEEELRLILANESHVSETSRSIALSALDFHQKQARHAMVPRREIVALSLHKPDKDNVAVMREHKFSRFPVYKNTVDDIVGIVFTKDIFKTELQLQPDFTLTSVLRDATFLPETATLERVLSTMLQKKAHMIILSDEYGSTAGLITLEDVLEELVGNIQDEYDRETPDITRVNENEFLVNGNITTSDIERLLSVEISPMDIRSIGGFFIDQLGHIPSAGEELRMDNVAFIAEKVADNTLELIRIKQLPSREDEDHHHD